MSKRFSGGFLFFSIVVAILIGFFVGERKDEFFSILNTQLGKKADFSARLDFSGAKGVYRQLLDKYDGNVKASKASEYVNKGIAESTGDPYTVYFTKDEAKKLQNSLEGTIGGGIGAELGKKDGHIAITKPLKDSPAEKAGVKIGDVIVSVDDEDVSSKSLDEIVSKVRGEVDTTVKIKVYRDSVMKEFNIKRKKITAPDVETKVIDGVGVLTVTRFGKDTGSKVRAEAEKLKNQNVKGIILDLRNNGGGYLQAGVDVAGLWLDNKVVVKEKGKHERDQTLKSGHEAILNDIPTVVLVNEGSASASEIVAGALKDNKAAQLVGKKTFGKGSVQQMVEMNNGAILKVTVAKWYTPNGKNINKDGIKPDKEVDLSRKDFENHNDTQLNYAVKELQK